MADARLFRMTSRWRLPFPSGRVFTALADADGYPRWWPQIRDAVRVDDRSGTARLRSVVPMSLHVTVTQQLHDPAAGMLRASVAGDLVGWSQWRISADGGAAIAEFSQEVSLEKRAIPPWLLGTLRPVLHLNHRYMMWSGRRGFIRYLSGRGP
ncbi:SRPBCC family protein [Gordonia sp. NPDC003424]